LKVFSPEIVCTVPFRLVLLFAVTTLATLLVVLSAMNV